MNYTAEFKLALDKPESGKWEDTPVHLTKEFPDAVPGANEQQWARDLAAYLANTCLCQVRWNWQGLSQGHYANVGD